MNRDKNPEIDIYTKKQSGALLSELYRPLLAERSTTSIPQGDTVMQW